MGIKKEVTLNVRVEADVHEGFVRKCSHMGRTYPDVVREIMDAFNDNRLKIIQTKEQKKQTGELYNVN